MSNSSYVKLCTIGGRDVYAKGMILRFGRGKGMPLAQSRQWTKLTKGERRMLRRAAFRKGNRHLAHESVHAMPAIVR